MSKHWLFIPLERIEQIVHGDNSMGICLTCGKEQGECEPDARAYKCSSCGANDVYGAEEIALMGYVK